MAASLTTHNNLNRFILQDVELGKNQLGEGAYGKVFEVEYAGTVCAAKEMHPIIFLIGDPGKLENTKKRFLEECRMWSVLRHPNIVQFIGLWYRDGDESGIPIIVMEKLQCSLRYFVKSHINQELQLNLKLCILHDVSKGLWYLHIQNPPIVHCDLTPNNILVGEYYRAKITDLGVAKIMKDTDSGRKMTKVAGTPHFMPPESFDDKPKYGPPLDIFSFGGVVLYTITQQWPKPKAREKHNPDTGRRELVSEVERRRQYLDGMTGVLSALQPLVVSCLDDSPNSRPSIVEVSKTIKGMMGDHNKEELGFVPQVLATHLSTVSPLATQLQQLTVQKPASVSSTTIKSIDWKILSPAPISGSSQTALLLDGLVYVGGGYDAFNHYSRYRIDIFDPVLNSWSTSPIQTSRCLFSMTILLNELIIAGGAVGYKSGWFSSDHCVVNEILLLDRTTEKLQKYNEMVTPRSAATAVGHEAVLIIMGGWDNDKTPLSSTELLDTTTNQWYVCNELPQPHCMLKPVIVTQVLYLVGGVNQDGNSTTVFAASLNSISQNHNITWRFLQDTPWHCSCPVIVNGSDIIIIGGRQNRLVAVRTSNIYRLNQVSGTWELIPPLIPEARSSPAVVDIGGNQILVVGGIMSRLSLFFHRERTNIPVLLGVYK